MTIVDDLLGRKKSTFAEDYDQHFREMAAVARRSSFLVVGGAGTIGAAVVHQLVKLGARKVDVVDISENNLVELVRDLRSSASHIVTELTTYAIDAGSPEFHAFFAAESPFDYVLNLSAMKHVRSERDPYTLSRLIDVNIFNSVDLLRMAADNDTVKYFCVSTDKAANPVNMMGASKRLMEQFIFAETTRAMVSTARFANVAFSDGSLLAGFENRLKKRQPLAVPTDIRRFFVSPAEAGELCVLSCLVAKDKEILYPKQSELFHDVGLAELSEKFLALNGYRSRACMTESEAIELAAAGSSRTEWPCYFFESDTTGEKAYEEFTTEDDLIDETAFVKIGVVRSQKSASAASYEEFKREVASWRQSGGWDKAELVKLFRRFLPNFIHEEKGKHLDQKM